MGHPQYPGMGGVPAGQFYGFPPPQPPKNTGLLKLVTAVAVLVIAVLGGLWAKQTYIDKKDTTTSTQARTASSGASVTTLPPVSAPPVVAAPPTTNVIEGGPGWEVEAGCIAVGKPPAVCKQMRDSRYPGGSVASPTVAAPAPAPATGPMPPPDAVQKYLRGAHTDAVLRSAPDQQLVQMGMQACTYLSTASGTPLSIGEGIAAQLNIPRSQAMVIMGAAAGAFCREYIDKTVR